MAAEIPHTGDRIPSDPLKQHHLPHSQPPREISVSQVAKRTLTAKDFKTPTELGDQEITALKDKIKEISNKINPAKVEELLPDLHITGEQIVGTLKKVDALFQKFRKVNDDLIVAKIKIEGKNQHVYIYYNIGDHDLQLIFDRHVKHKIEPGSYKSLREAINISDSGEVQKKFFTKSMADTVGTFKSISPNSKLSETQRNAIILFKGLQAEYFVAQLKIPGTSIIHFVTPYIGKEDTIKLGTLSRYYPNGNLGGDTIPSLSIEKRFEILKELTKTMTDFHAHGLSHNDLKLENVVLDEEFRPVLIDFGNTTYEGNSSFRSTSIEILPPEIIKDNNYSLITDFISDFTTIRKLKKELETLKKDYTELFNQNKNFLQQENSDINVSSELNEFQTKMSQSVLKMRHHEDLIYRTTKNLNEKSKYITQNLNLSQWIPKKNDDFGLGLIADKLIPLEKRTPEISTIIEGLLNPDPNQRLTSAQAYELLQNCHLSPS